MLTSLWSRRYSDKTLDSVIMFSPTSPKIQPIVIKWYICIYSGFITHHALCFSMLFHVLCPVAKWLPAVFSSSRFCPTQMALLHPLSDLPWSTSFPCQCPAGFRLSSFDICFCLCGAMFSLTPSCIFENLSWQRMTCS